MPVSTLPLMAAMATLTVAVPAHPDSQALLRLHQAAIQAHLDQDVEALLEDESDDYVVASRGQVTHPTKQERRDRLGPYLAATEFSVYRDEIEPVVTVSQDGTLGWVIVRIYARGTQSSPDGKAQPVEFRSAWVELYEKRNGRWLRVGNVSNFET